MGRGRHVRPAQGHRPRSRPARGPRGRARRPRWDSPWRVGLWQPWRRSPWKLVLLGGWQFVRKNRLIVSAKADTNLFMSNAALATNIVSLDEYRRTRGGGAKMMASRPVNQAAPTYPAPAVWVYWVPVWVW